MASVGAVVGAVVSGAELDGAAMDAAVSGAESDGAAVDAAVSGAESDGAAVDAVVSGSESDGAAVLSDDPFGSVVDVPPACPQAAREKMMVRVIKIHINLFAIGILPF